MILIILYLRDQNIQLRNMIDAIRKNSKALGRFIYDMSLIV